MADGISGHHTRKRIKMELAQACVIFLSTFGMIFLFVQYVSKKTSPDPGFTKLPAVSDVDCARLFQGERKYIEEIASRRPSIVDPPSGVATCDAIKRKIYPPRNPDTNFPILFGRLVYKDYTFLEQQLVANYARENVYCFSIDMKAPKIFHERIRKLAECLPNVLISKKELDLDSAGHNHNEAHLDCMSSAMDRKWGYVVLMQNHDVLIKTHAEMAEILKIYGGANDVDIGPCPDHRCIASLEKNLGRLKLCPSDFTGTRSIICSASNIQFGKGAMQAMISRAAAEFILTRINISPFMKELNDMDYGVDEQLYQSLQITPILDFPGAFHPKCMGTDSQFSTRVALASWDRPANTENWCASGKIRHDMMPQFDYAVVSCIAELLFNRSQQIIESKIDRKHYENINLVRYHHESKEPGFSIDEFKCEL